MQFKNAIIGNNVYGDDIVIPKIDEKFDYHLLTHRYKKSDQPDKELFDPRTINYELSENNMVSAHRK